MKNRRNVVIALLLIAALCVGIGYAAMDASISFTGKIDYNNENTFAIYWAEVTEGKSLGTVDGEGTPTLSIDMDTTEWTLGDTKTIKATVKNNSRYNAINVAVTNASALANYTITTAIEDSKNTLLADDTDTVVVVITITMNTYPVDSLTDATFTFNVTAQQGTSK